MTETTAKSGGSGTSTTPVGEDPKKDGAAPAGRETPGRAAVPADAPSAPKFTRAPGMAPPPGEPSAEADGSSEPKRPGGPGVAKGSATVPIVTKGKGAAPSRPTVTPPPAAPQRPGAAANQPGNVTGGGKPQQRPGSSSGPIAGGAAAVGAARVTEAARSAR